MKLMVSLLLFLQIFAETRSSHAVEWLPIPGTSRMFDASRIRRVSPSVVRIWERHTDNLDEFLLNNELSSQYKDYSYTLCLIQIDCTNYRFGYVRILDYDFYGKVIPASSVVHDDLSISMNYAVPGSISGKVVQQVCNFVDAE